MPYDKVPKTFVKFFLELLFFTNQTFIYQFDRIENGKKKFDSTAHGV